MNQIVLGKLTDAFSWGCTDREACIHADISEDTLYEYCKKHPEFSELKERKKETPILKARETILNKVTESYANSMDYLKRKRKKEFGDAGSDSENPINIKVEGEIEIQNAIRRIAHREDNP